MLTGSLVLESVSTGHAGWHTLCSLSSTFPGQREWSLTAGRSTKVIFVLSAQCHSKFCREVASWSWDNSRKNALARLQVKTATKIFRLFHDAFRILHSKGSARVHSILTKRCLVWCTLCYWSKWPCLITVTRNSPPKWLIFMGWRTIRREMPETQDQHKILSTASHICSHINGVGQKDDCAYLFPRLFSERSAQTNLSLSSKVPPIQTVSVLKQGSPVFRFVSAGTGGRKPRTSYYLRRGIE